MFSLGCKHYLRSGTNLKVSRRAFSRNSKKVLVAEFGIKWVLRAESLRVWSAYTVDSHFFSVHAGLTAFLLLFYCHDIAGKWFLRSDYSMSCFSSAHAEFLPSFSLQFQYSLLFSLSLYVRSRGEKVYSQLSIGNVMASVLHFRNTRILEFHELWRYSYRMLVFVVIQSAPRWQFWCV